ncbi:MAG: ribosome silencing factor [Actinomycetota bacterium]
MLKWVRLAVDAADDKLAQDTEAFYVGEIMGITDWFVVASGSNPRQVRAIVEEVEEQLTRANGPKPVRIEGKEGLEWVLMDYGAFIVHVFSVTARDYYDLERLWKDVPRLTDVA